MPSDDDQPAELPSGLPRRALQSDPEALPRRARSDPAALPKEFRSLTRPEPLAAKPKPAEKSRPAAERIPGAKPGAVAEPRSEATPRPQTPQRPAPTDAHKPAAHHSGVSPRMPAPRSRLSTARTRTPVAAAALSLPAPPTAVPDDGRRLRASRPAFVVAIVCAVVVLLGTGALLWLPGDDPATDRTAPVGTAATAGGATSSPEFDAPTRLVSDTEYVETVVLEGGRLQVTHWIRTAAPINLVSLSVSTGSGLAESEVEVEQIVVAADGARVDAPDSVMSEEGWSGLPAAQDLYVQYELSGVLQRSSSAQGRALATMTSLEVGVGQPLIARTRTFPGSQVLTLACLPPGRQALPAPCGTLDDDVWTVVSQADAVRDTVIAQFDLAEG